MRHIVGRAFWPPLLELAAKIAALQFLADCQINPATGMPRLAVPLEAVRRHGSRQRYLKRMPKPDQVLRIQRNYVSDGEKKGDGKKGVETTRTPE